VYKPVCNLVKCIYDKGSTNHLDFDQGEINERQKETIEACHQESKKGCDKEIKKDESRIVLSGFTHFYKLVYDLATLPFHILKCFMARIVIFWNRIRVRF